MGSAHVIRSRRWIGADTVRRKEKPKDGHEDGAEEAPAFCEDGVADFRRLLQCREKKDDKGADGEDYDSAEGNKYADKTVPGEVVPGAATFGPGNTYREQAKEEERDERVKARVSTHPGTSLYLDNHLHKEQGEEYGKADIETRTDRAVDEPPAGKKGSRDPVKEDRETYKNQLDPVPLGMRFFEALHNPVSREEGDSREVHGVEAHKGRRGEGSGLNNEDEDIPQSMTQRKVADDRCSDEGGQAVLERKRSVDER